MQQGSRCENLSLMISDIYLYRQFGKSRLDFWLYSGLQLTICNLFNLASTRVKKVSLWGCTRLKNQFKF
jgi:hypothetical protein